MIYNNHSLFATSSVFIVGCMLESSILIDGVTLLNIICDVDQLLFSSSSGERLPETETGDRMPDVNYYNKAS